MTVAVDMDSVAVAAARKREEEDIETMAGLSPRSGKKHRVDPMARGTFYGCWSDFGTLMAESSCVLVQYKHITTISNHMDDICIYSHLLEIKAIDRSPPRTAFLTPR